MKLKKLMNDFLQDYLKQNEIEFSEWSVNVNNQEGFGDYSSNIALKLAKILKKAPIDLANDILEFYKEDNLFSGQTHYR